MEDRLRALESQKRLRPQESSKLPKDLAAPIGLSEALLPLRSSRGSFNHRQTRRRSLIELDDLDSSSSSTVTHHRHKRQRFTRGIKITLSYTLRVSSSL
jgi:hypothetical protein